MQAGRGRIVSVYADSYGVLEWRTRWTPGCYSFIVVRLPNYPRDMIDCSQVTSSNTEIAVSQYLQYCLTNAMRCLPLAFLPPQSHAHFGRAVQ